MSVLVGGPYYGNPEHILQTNNMFCNLEYMSGMTKCNIFVGIFVI